MFILISQSLWRHVILQPLEATPRGKKGKEANKEAKMGRKKKALGRGNKE